MVKLLRKSLVITLSSLCALSTSVDVKVSASKVQDNLDRKLGEQVVDYDEKKEAHIGKNSTWAFGNMKDYALDVLIGAGALIGSGLLGAEAFRDNNKGIGAILGASLGGIITIPYTVRNFIRRWREKDYLGAEFILKVISRSSQEAKHKKVMDMAKKSGTGSFSIL